MSQPPARQGGSSRVRFNGRAPGRHQGPLQVLGRLACAQGKQATLALSRLLPGLGKALLALAASFSWAAAYPYSNLTTDLVWLVLLVLFLLAQWAGGSRSRRAVRIFCLVSSIAGVTALAWSSLSWHQGLWYPQLAPELHRVLSTDGEASYNAFDAQLFILIFTLSWIPTYAVLRVQRRRAPRADLWRLP